MRERLLAKRNERKMLFGAHSWFRSEKLAEAVKLLRRKVDEGSVGDSDEPDNVEYSDVIDKEQGENPDGHENIAAIKSNNGLFPKDELQEMMKDYPSGTYLVLETTTPKTNVKLVAIGYKYNSRKFLCFIMTKDAGSSAPGHRLYIAKFPDKFGNIKERKC
jgi:hypothetical protein